MYKELEAFFVDKLGNELSLFTVRSTESLDCFISRIIKSFVYNANKLYIELNSCFIKDIPKRLEEEYIQAITSNNPQRASLLALYIKLLDANMQVKEFYIISNNTKYPLKFSVLKFFDYNLKPEDEMISTIYS